jgi:hypothetical protein
VKPTPALSLASELPFPDVGLRAFVHQQWPVGSCIDDLCGLPSGMLRDGARWRRVGRRASPLSGTRRGRGCVGWTDWSGETGGRMST